MIFSTIFAVFACSTAPEAPVPTPAAPVSAPAPTPAAVPTPEPPSPAAGGGHAHASPHGGEVQTVGDMHVEALMTPAGVMFYVSDGAQNALPIAGYSGSAIVKGPAGVTTVDLAPMGDHLFAAATLADGQPATAVLTLTHNGKAVSASFESKGVGTAVPAGTPPEAGGHDHASHAH